MDYHGRIMNIQCVVPTSVIWPTSYKFGHRDARHAAAEIALEAQREIDDTGKKLAVAKEIISALREIHGDQAAEIARLREALTHIAEYWNRSENDTAMNDALFHMIETAEAALAQAAEVPNETV